MPVPPVVQTSMFNNLLSIGSLWFEQAWREPFMGVAIFQDVLPIFCCSRESNLSITSTKSVSDLKEMLMR